MDVLYHGNVPSRTIPGAFTPSPLITDAQMTMLPYGEDYFISSYDLSYSLPLSHVISENILNAGYERDITTEKLNTDGITYVERYIQGKKINISFFVQGQTEEELNNTIKEFQSLFCAVDNKGRRERFWLYVRKNNDTYIRYLVRATGLDGIFEESKGYNATYREGKLTLVCDDVFAESEAYTETLFTSQVYSGNGFKEFEVEVPSGTEQTYPVITITFTAQNNVIKTTVSNEVYTGQCNKLTTTEVPTNGSVFVFNGDENVFTVNGIVKQYVGKWFPLLPSYGKRTKNIIRLALECTSATVNVSIKYKIKER